MLTALSALIGAVLYRLRGGWLKTLTGTNSSQLCRAVWAIPTAALITWQAEAGLLTGALLCVSVFLSMALIGHGAHMIFGPAYWPIFGSKLTPKQQTELLTSWWLPDVFGGLPGEPDWTDLRVDLFNCVGMSFIGLVRNFIAVLPLVMLSPLGVAVYTGTGLLHGPLYWFGWKFTPDIRAAELLVGAVSWAAIVLIF